MILDNQSTVNVFCNGDRLTKICRINKSITNCTNGGETLVNKVGYFRGYGWVWYNPHVIANTLSLMNRKAPTA